MVTQHSPDSFGDGIALLAMVLLICSQMLYPLSYERVVTQDEFTER